MEVDRSRIGALDGLRALAILLVMMFHFTRGHGSALLWRVTDIGWAGVDLFFVLSGFLITGILLRSKGTDGYFRNFYARRALRILPLSYATLAVAFILLPWTFGECPAVPMRQQAPLWFYYANFAAMPSSPCYVLGHFWSLAIEEQFYLIWPVVLLRSREATASRICLFLIATSLVSRLALSISAAPGQSTFSWTFARLDGLALGALIALSFRSEDLRRRLKRVSGPLLIGSAILLALVITTGQSTKVFETGDSATVIAMRSGGPLLLAVVFAALMVLSLTNPSFGKVFTGPIGAAIARYSYGAYVFHLFLMPAYMHTFPRTRVRAILGTDDAALAAFAVFGMLATVAVAAISYHAFEAFFLRLRPRRQESSGAALAAQEALLT